MKLLQDLIAIMPVAEDFHDDEHEANAYTAGAPSEHDRPVANDERAAQDQLIASDDEFSVYLDTHHMVHLHDGADRVVVSMPYHVWYQLADETMHKHVEHMQARDGGRSTLNHPEGWMDSEDH